jgi:predicted peptidase
MELRVVTSSVLPYLFSIPSRASAAERLPLLCFLHGYDEAAPLEIRDALTRHGPLQATAAPAVRREFLVVAPQLPRAGDIWSWYADAVQELVMAVQQQHRGDIGRTYLSGFSFGGNGVFDLALSQRDFWAALWAVDPTRVPASDPQRPTWVSIGEVARFRRRSFIDALQLQPLFPARAPGERVYLDEGADHVGSATLAYADERIYSWILSHHLNAR